jgi:nucleotide-binding universal stress UspA family protein
MTTESVVVGVDQSVQSAAALKWAVNYARRTGTSLRVVSAHPHHAPPMPYTAGVAGIPLVEQQAWVEESHAAIKALFDSIRPEPHWTLTQIDGSPGPELIAAARDASLLVVGTREHVGADRFLEGSVSHYCVRHAQVPVVVVPASEVQAAETATSGEPAIADAPTT